MITVEKLRIPRMLDRFMSVRWIKIGEVAEKSRISQLLDPFSVQLRQKSGKHQRNETFISSFIDSLIVRHSLIQSSIAFKLCPIILQ